MSLSAELSPAFGFPPPPRIPRLCTSLVNRLSDAVWELRLGVRTTGGEPSPHPDARGYGYLAYHTYAAIFRQVNLQPADVVVDLGAGKGRVVCVAATHPIRKAVGVEIDPALAAIGAANLAGMRGRRAAADVVCRSAADFNFDEATVIVMFHPFGADTMREVLDGIEASLARSPRALRIAYANPLLSPMLAARTRLRLDAWWTPRPWSRIKFPVHFYAPRDLSPPGRCPTGPGGAPDARAGIPLARPVPRGPLSSRPVRPASPFRRHESPVRRSTVLNIMEQNQQIITWLKDAHALEQNLENNLQAHIAETRDQPEIEAQLKQHLDETRGHRRRVEAALSGLGASPSKIKTLAGGVMGMMEGVSTAVFADRQLKNIMADYAMEHFEIAFYRCLRVAANEAGLADIATMCEEILKEETAMAEWLEEQIPDMTRAHLQTQAASR